MFCVYLPKCNTKSLLIVLCIIKIELKLDFYDRDGGRKRIFSSVLEAIGDTPMVRLSNLEKEYGLKCELRKM